jgi:SOS response regulatory protein OraA/RecX
MDANERAKHYRFLLTRGFSSEVVRKVVKLSGAPDEDFEQ